MNKIKLLREICKRYKYELVIIDKEISYSKSCMLYAPTFTDIDSALINWLETLESHSSKWTKEIIYIRGLM